MTGPLDVLQSVVEALQGVGGRYCIGGSWASSASGVPRQTNDIDLVVDLPADRLEAFVETLGREFYSDAEDLRAALLKGSSSNLIHLATGLKIDLFPIGPGPFDESEFERRRLLEFDRGRAFYVKSAEDTVIRKLLWFREGGEVSERQWTDVLGILRVQGAGLDSAYLRRWAEVTGVSDLLDRARSESERSPG